MYGSLGLPAGARIKEPTCQSRRCKRLGFDPWVGKIPCRRTWQPTPVFLPAESMDGVAWQATVHRNAESDTTEEISNSTCIYLQAMYTNLIQFNGLNCDWETVLIYIWLLLPDSSQQIIPKLASCLLIFRMLQ